MSRFPLFLSRASADLSTVAGAAMGVAALMALDGTELPVAIVFGAAAIASITLVRGGLAKRRDERTERNEADNRDWAAAVAYQTLCHIKNAQPIDMAGPYADLLVSLREGTIDYALDELTKAFPGVADRLNGDDE